jgi:hypothetical protein
MVVIDACRTSPFARSGKGIGGGEGLAPPPQAKGVFSLYAARDRLSERRRVLYFESVGFLGRFGQLRA